MSKRKIGKENMDFVKGGKNPIKQQAINSNSARATNEFAEITKIGKRLMDNFFGKT
tara:strand:- start:4135 stop:4302 length:168 start_codon:yes stop_codon:yes gene_type:complete